MINPAQIDGSAIHSIVSTKPIRCMTTVSYTHLSMDSVMAQYQKTVRPMFLQFIEPSKQYADIIVPRGGKNRIAIDILKAKISQFFE